MAGNNVEKLRYIADRMQGAIDKIAPPYFEGQNMTHKRAGQAEAKQKKYELACKVQDAIYGLADAWEEDRVPSLLQKVTQKNVIEWLVEREDYPKGGMMVKVLHDIYDYLHDISNRDGEESHFYEFVSDLLSRREGEHWMIQFYTPFDYKCAKNLEKWAKDRKIRQDKYSEWFTGNTTIWSNFQKANICNDVDYVSAREELLDLTTPPDPDEIKHREMLALERELQLKKIPGFFPTPDDIADYMGMKLMAEPGHKVLEPSAGTGRLIEAAMKHNNAITIFFAEHNMDLHRYLELKYWPFKWYDFEVEPPPGYPETFDRIIMNPPFEKKMDIDHVRRAWDFLAPGGKIIAIMSGGTLWRADKKSQDFAIWFDEVDGKVLKKLDNGEFKESGTMVNAIIVELNKPNVMVQHTGSSIKKVTVSGSTQLTLF